MKHLIAFFSKLTQFIFFLIVLNVASVHAQEPMLQTKDKYVKIETKFGAMIFELSQSTPKHSANFIKLVKSGYFDKYEFNRVIKDFVAQGGETDSAYAAMEKHGEVLERIMPEFNPNLIHRRGALAAGRDDNPQRASFLGQFYVVDGRKYTDSTLRIAERRMGKNFTFSAEARQIYQEVGGVPFLDQNYTVFGQLIKGMDVLDQITMQPTNKADLPITKIPIKVTLLSKKQTKALLAQKN